MVFFSSSSRRPTIDDDDHDEDVDSKEAEEQEGFGSALAGSKDRGDVDVAATLGLCTTESYVLRTMATVERRAVSVK
ncbi:hypothetical protein GWI33_004322 [Rhynchophorus ferrugineus]|nr:hypothetical protein GWI33_004322 [Rhynchophorus ferrugineus]